MSHNVIESSNGTIGYQVALIDARGFQPADRQRQRAHPSRPRAHAQGEDLPTELVKRQTVDGELKYAKLDMTDDQGHHLTLLVDHEHSELRRRTGQVTEEEKAVEDKESYLHARTQGRSLGPAAAAAAAASTRQRRWRW